MSRTLLNRNAETHGWTCAFGKRCRPVDATNCEGLQHSITQKVFICFYVSSRQFWAQSLDCRGHHTPAASQPATCQKGGVWARYMYVEKAARQKGGGWASPKLDWEWGLALQAQCLDMTPGDPIHRVTSRTSTPITIHHPSLSRNVYVTNIHEHCTCHVTACHVTSRHVTCHVQHNFTSRHVTSGHVTHTVPHHVCARIR